MAQETTGEHPTREWLVWSGGLLAAYLLATWANWGRTLIETEIWALYFAGRPWGEQLAAIRGDLVHPPLMYFIERGWIVAFGGSDSAVKSLPLVINVPTFFLFPLLAKKVTGHWRLASFLFLAVYLRAGSVPQLVRMYGLALLLVVGCLLLWEKWQREPHTGTLAAWAVCAALLLYTHLFGALVLAAFVLANCMAGPRKLAFTAAAGVAGAAFLPWLLYVLPVYRSRGLEENVWWVNKSIRFEVADFFYGLMGGVYPVAPQARIWLTLGVVLVHAALLVLALYAVKRVGLPRRVAGQTNQWFWTSVVLTAFPFLLALGFSVTVVPSLHWRFLLGVFPTYWLLVTLIGQESGRAGRILLYGILLPWTLVMTGTSYVMREQPSGIRQAARMLADEPQPADRILCETQCAAFYWEWTRWLGRSGRIERTTETQSATTWLQIVPKASLRVESFAGVARVWMLSEKLSGTTPSVRDVLRQNGFLRERSAQFGDVVAEVYTRAQASNAETRQR